MDGHILQKAELMANYEKVRSSARQSHRRQVTRVGDGSPPESRRGESPRESLLLRGQLLLRNRHGFASGHHHQPHQSCDRSTADVPAVRGPRA